MNIAALLDRALQLYLFAWHFLVLPLVVGALPGFITYKYFRYLIAAAWGELRITFKVNGADIQRRLHVDRVFGAALAALACLIIFGFFLLLQKLDVDGQVAVFGWRPVADMTSSAQRFSLVVGEQDRRAFFVGLNRILIAFVIGWSAYAFHRIVRAVVVRQSAQLAIEIYAMVYLLVQFRGESNYSIIKFVSYGYSDIVKIFVDGLNLSTDINEKTFWPEQLFQFIVYLIVIVLILRYVLNVVFQLQARKSNGSEGAFDLEAIRAALNAFVWIFAVGLALSTLKIDLLGFGLFTGLVGAGLSISLRDLLNNCFSGVLLNLDKSIKVNDVIRTSDGVVGEVKKISLRYTFLETKDNIDILIPNSLLVQSKFENLTRTRQEVRLSLRFSVGQNVDIDQIRNLVLRACLYVPEVSGVAGRTPLLLYLGPTESGNLFDLRFWVIHPRDGVAKLQSDVAFAIFREFKKKEIPLPAVRQMTIDDLKEDSTLPQLPAAAGRAARQGGGPLRRTS